MRSITCFIGICCICQSCIMYRPAPIYVTNIEKKGDLELAATMSNPISVQIAYAIYDNIGLIGDLTKSYNIRHSSFLSSGIEESGRLGVGYFLKKSEGLNFEIFSGGGIGSIKSKRKKYPDYMTPLYRNFIQTSLFYRFQSLNIGISVRREGVYYKTFIPKELITNPAYDTFDEDIHNRNFNYLATVLNLGFSNELFFVSLQTGLNYGINHPKPAKINFEKKMFSLTFGYRISHF